MELSAALLGNIGNGVIFVTLLGAIWRLGTQMRVSFMMVFILPS